MVKKEYKIISAKDILGIGNNRIVGSANGNAYTIMDLSDAEVIRVISQGAQVYYEGKLMSVSDFTEPVEPQAIDNASCVTDDYTSNSKNIINSRCKVVGVPRKYKTPLVAEEHSIVVADATALLAAIDTAEEGREVYITADITEPLTISKPVHIVGNGNTLGGIIEINANDGDVILEDIVFSGAVSEKGTGAAKTTSKGSSITFKGNCNVLIKDCTIKGQTNFYNIMSVQNAGTFKMRNVTVGDNACYNGIEFGIKTPIKSGGYVCDCTFGKKPCTNNILSMYAFEDNAVFNLDRNHFDYSAAAYRFGNTFNSKNIQINITDNTYDSTANTDASAYFKAGYSDTIYWSGLFFFEGHSDNMDFTQMHVIAKNCKYKGQAIKYIKTPANYEEQVYYHCWDKNTFAKTYADVTIL